MRRQSFRAAMRCETARNPTCRCRCGGKLHGATRSGKWPEEPDPQFFESLPADDPHHVASAAEKKQVRKQARIERVRAETLACGQLGLFDEVS